MSHVNEPMGHCLAKSSCLSTKTSICRFWALGYSLWIKASYTNYCSRHTRVWCPHLLPNSSRRRPLLSIFRVATLLLPYVLVKIRIMLPLDSPSLQEKSLSSLRSYISLPRLPRCRCCYLFCWGVCLKAQTSLGCYGMFFCSYQGWVSRSGNTGSR